MALGALISSRKTILIMFFVLLIFLLKIYNKLMFRGAEAMWRGNAFLIVLKAKPPLVFFIDLYVEMFENCLVWRILAKYIVLLFFPVYIIHF